MSTTNTAPAAPASTPTPTFKQEAVEALHKLISAVAPILGGPEAVALVEKAVQVGADAAVDAIEVASSALPGGALIVQVEKMTLPWGEHKLVLGFDALIEKLSAKVAPAPTAAPADANATPAAQVNAL